MLCPGGVGLSVSIENAALPEANVPTAESFAPSLVSVENAALPEPNIGTPEAIGPVFSVENEAKP